MGAEPRVYAATAAAVLSIATVRVWLGWTDVAALATKALPDDAFYYFQIARNLAHGRGASFDGLSPTNGFHPLWLALITPLFAGGASDSDTSIRVALALGTACSILTAIVVYAVARRLTGDAVAAALAAVCYSLNPSVVLEAMNGLETSLATLLFSGTVWYWISRDRDWTEREALTFGVIAGFAILARTDNVFLLAMLVLARLFNPFRWERLREAGLAGAVVAGVVSPWVVWSIAATGSAIQTSGLAVPYVLHGNIAPEAGTDSLLRWILAETLNGIRLALRHSGTWWPPLPFVLVGGALVIAQRRRQSQLRTQLGTLNPIVATILILVLFHSAYRLYPRSWYFAPLGLLSAWYVAVLVAYVRTELRPRLSTALVAAAMLAVIAGNTIQLRALWRGGVYRWQREMLSAAQWIDAHTSGADRVGAFNAGIMAYWNPGRVVISLDGVVNTPAFAAIRERRLWSYVEAVGITHIIDYEPYLWAPPADFSNTYAPYFGVQFRDHVVVIGTIPGTLHGSDIVITRLRQ